jgi:hypothetical protein
VNFRSPPEYDRNRPVRSLSATHASPGFWSLQRLQNRGATYPGFTSPGYAASPGFRTLLTPYSPRNLSALFQTVTLLGFRPSKVSPFASWVRSLDQPYPHGVGSNGRVSSWPTPPRSPPGQYTPRKSVASSLQAAGVARSSLELSSPPGVILPLRRPRSSRVPPPMDFDQVGGEPSTVSGPPECRSKRA